MKSERWHRTGPLVSVLAGLAVIAGCSTVPITGRQQLDLVSDSEMISLSAQQYNEFLSANRLSNNAGQTELVKRVGGRIAGAVERYFRERGMPDQLNGYNWDFNLVENDEANAWALPGGKVVVYTGLLPITRDENGLAVVLGHEISHAVARHGDERMSQGLLAQLGGLALSEALSQKPDETRRLWMSAFGVGVQVGAILPFSRTQESEADHLGLIFMAMAGYPPDEALAFWERMSENKSGLAPPEFLSTHPSDRSRIEKIREELPEARQYVAAR